MTADVYYEYIII